MNKIVITIQGLGEGLSAPMDQRFGRAERFLVVDADCAGVLQTVVNPSIDAAHGAGTGAAALMREIGAAAVISGRFGPKAFDALDALGLQVWIAPPGLTALQALEQYRSGTLERMELKVYR
jgi:predicted Fe-Mo cluster-binding NifX family protein